MLDNTSPLHRLATELTNRYLVAVIPINEHKQPLAITVVDKRNRLATVEELEDYFGPKGSIKAGRLAILLDSPIPLCALDLDGTGVTIFQKKVSLKFSEQMKFKINNSMKTETPNNGLHILFRLRKEDFPSGIKSKKYWTDTGNGKKHNEINLIGTGHYLVERGPGYIPIKGPEHLVTLSKKDVDELLNILEEFKKETEVIRNSASKLVEYYQPTNRDNLVFALSGYFHKNFVPDFLINDLIEYLIGLAGGDEESEKRFDTVKYTCAKAHSTVSGRSRLLEAVNVNEDAIAYVEREFGKLGFHFNSIEESENHLDLDLDYPRRLMEDFTLRTLRDTGEIWIYDDERGIFLPGAETILAARIEEDLGGPQMNEKGELEPSKLTTYRVDEYLDHIRRRTFMDRDEFNPSIEWLACANSMINLVTGETTPFSPDFMCTTQIPVIYNYGFGMGPIADFFRLVEGAKQRLDCLGLRIRKFLYEIMSSDDVELFLDFLAYCLWRSYKFNLWMLISGAGLNGKSILLTLIERFFGKQNVSGETLDRLLKEKFAVGNLFQKMVNVDADVSATVIFKNTGILKKLSGNDVHIGEFKFKNPFKFVNYAKLIFSCNKIPETEDLTDAFLRRILIISFTQQFFGDKDDPDLIEKLTTEEELSGLLHEVISRLPRVLKNGIKKITSESIAETYEQYIRGSNPVKYFYEKALGHKVGNKVPKREMCEHFEKFCRYHGLSPESDQSFSRKLTEEFHLRYDRFRLNGERVYCWVDIELVDYAKKEREEQSNLEEIGSLSEEQKEAMK